MNSIAIIRKKKKSSWISCQSITANLEQMYRIAFPDSKIRIFHTDTSMNQYETGQVANEIFDYHPEKIVFIDHHPHPGFLLKSLDLLYDENRPEFYFHVYGDFTLKPSDWLEVEHILQKAQTTFFCASERQVKLISSFINSDDDNKKSIHYLPFPVNNDVFYFDSTNREEIRKELGIGKDDFMFLYTGRLSIQKNVLQLISIFGFLQEYNISRKSHLIIAGGVDDIGIPYIGESGFPGSFFTTFSNVLENKILHKNSKYIQYAGNLENEKLREIYNAADCFISLSTHNDEDFGMSPAEAMCSGCPLLLSDWAGYASFETINKNACKLIPVDIQNKMILPIFGFAIKAMITTLKNSYNQEKRKQDAKHAANSLSIEKVAIKLREFHEKTPPHFDSFNTLLAKLHAAYISNKKAPFKGENGFSHLFKEIYSSYFNQEWQDEK
ncbi:MAG: glycosyltransferase family 4 protein [Bacteriovoracaceae bacterium]|nr:glycosyltransferase family 4 protein [Bacteriovoracaceae bacterium]